MIFLNVKTIKIKGCLGILIWSYSGQHFPAFGLNTERCYVSLRISPNTGKCGQE